MVVGIVVGIVVGMVVGMVVGIVVWIVVGMVVGIVVGGKLSVHSLLVIFKIAYSGGHSSLFLKQIFL
jgi:hypothetical protein